MKSTIVLVGHGATTPDIPREWISELKILEARRMQSAQPLKLSDREAELDHKVRHWPRTAESDPYKAGLETIAQALEKKIPGAHVIPAYNEFCAPSIEEAVAEAVLLGAERVALISTMFTRGGIHSECEIPMIVKALQAQYPQVQIQFAWPFQTETIANFLQLHLDEFLAQTPSVK